MANWHGRVLLHECLLESLRLSPHNDAQCPDVEELITPYPFSLLKHRTSCLTISDKIISGITQLSIVHLHLNLPYLDVLYQVVDGQPRVHYSSPHFSNNWRGFNFATPRAIVGFAEWGNNGSDTMIVMSHRCLTESRWCFRQRFKHTTCTIF